MLERFLLTVTTSLNISWLHMLLLKAPLRFMPLSAHKGAIRNKDPINPSDVSTGTAALGYCLWQIKSTYLCVQEDFFFLAFSLFRRKSYTVMLWVSFMTCILIQIYSLQVQQPQQENKSGCPALAHPQNKNYSSWKWDMDRTERKKPQRFRTAGEKRD